MLFRVGKNNGVQFSRGGRKVPRCVPLRNHCARCVKFITGNNSIFNIYPFI